MQGLLSTGSRLPQRRVKPPRTSELLGTRSEAVVTCVAACARATASELKLRSSSSQRSAASLLRDMLDGSIAEPPSETHRDAPQRNTPLQGSRRITGFSFACYERAVRSPRSNGFGPAVPARELQQVAADYRLPSTLLRSRSISGSWCW